MKVTANDIAQLLASPPPRPVPAHVAKAALRTSGGGCIMPFVGLMFVGMGVFFTFLFSPMRFRDDWRLAGDGVLTTTGVIRSVTDTHMEINDVKVAEYAFSYTPDGGRHLAGRCFTTGREWNEGATVTVRYLKTNPELACIDGARLSEGGWGGGFVILFPLIGGGFIVRFFMDRHWRKRVLSEGLTAEVDVLSVDETATKVNDQNVYRITLTAPGPVGGPPVTVKRVNRADVNLVLKHARDKQPVFILYDPRKPSRMIFPEALIEPVD